MEKIAQESSNPGFIISEANKGTFLYQINQRFVKCDYMILQTKIGGWCKQARLKKQILKMWIHPKSLI